MTGIAIDGEFIFDIFCTLWLIFGGSALVFRIADGLQRVELVRDAQKTEEEVARLAEDQNQGRQMVLEDLDSAVEERQLEFGKIERELAGLDEISSPIIRIVGRELPKPSEHLWLTTYVDPNRPTLGRRYIGAWAQDPAYARAKVLVGLGEREDPPTGDYMTLPQLKKSMFEPSENQFVATFE